MRPDPMEQAAQAGRQLHRFPGGLRLRHNKAISCELPVTRAELAPRLYIPLPRRPGEEAEVLVSPGQQVRKGDPIAHAGRGGWTHASTSGLVEAVASHPISHPSGRDGPCIVIEPDGHDQWTDLHPLGDWRQADPAELRRLIREAAGVLGAEALVILAEEGIENAWQRHADNHRALRAGIEAMGLTFVVDEPHRLPQLNSVSIPDGVDDAAVRSRLLNEYSLEIGAGLGPMAGKIWRIGLMGYASNRRNVLLCLGALDAVLSDLGAPVQSGVAVQAAMQAYAQL